MELKYRDEKEKNKLLSRLYITDTTEKESALEYFTGVKKKGAKFENCEAESVKEEDGVRLVGEVVVRVGAVQVELVEVEPELDHVARLALLEKVPEQHPEELGLSESV